MTLQVLQLIYIPKFLVDFDTNALRKKVNEVQKQIAAKKKVCFLNGSIKYPCVIQLSFLGKGIRR